MQHFLWLGVEEEVRDSKLEKNLTFYLWIKVDGAMSKECSGF